VRIAAVGDLHCTKTSLGVFHPLLEQAASSADVLLLAGDLTDNGTPEEARVLVKELTAVHVPIVAVLGNHDFECGKTDEVRRILVDAGVNVLDESYEVHGLGIAGVKGFCGGFGQRALAAWGEDGIKHFVREAVDGRSSSRRRWRCTSN
jgi:Icc-related predicted phosphoesterase